MAVVVGRGRLGDSLVPGGVMGNLGVVGVRGILVQDGEMDNLVPGGVMGILGVGGVTDSLVEGEVRGRLETEGRGILHVGRGRRGCRAGRGGRRGPGRAGARPALCASASC